MKQFEQNKSTYKSYFTKDFFSTAKILRQAMAVPIIENVKMALSSIKTLLFTLTANPEKQGKITTEIKKIEEIEKVLFGKMNDDRIMDLCNKYGVQWTTGEKNNDKPRLLDIQNLVSKIFDTFGFIRELAREQELFEKDPEEETEDSEDF